MPDFLSDDGIRLHYVVRGSGPTTILYLHWMGGDTSNWTGLWSAVDSSRFCHVALDFRGHGQSDTKPSTFSNQRLASDVLQLADTLGVQRFVVVGHSFGAKIAIELAAIAPMRVAGLVLIGALGPAAVPLDRDAVEAILNRVHDIAFVRDFFRSWIAVWPRAEIDSWLENFVKTPLWVHRAVCETALWTDITAETRNITTPALVIAGEHDPVYGPAYQRAAVLPAVPHARMIMVDCGHGLILERPEEIAGHCELFLGSLLS